MKLYFAPFACSFAARVAIYEAALDCEFERVDLRQKVTETGADFFAVTAKGKVSALALDSGDVLTENPAVLQYIAEQDPTGQLLPTDNPVQRYQVISWLSFVTSEIHKMGLYPLAAPHIPEAMTAITNSLLDKQLQLVNDRLAQQDYIAGAFSVADTYLFWALTLLPKLGYVIPEGLTALAAYQQRLAQRPAFQRTLTEESALMAAN